MTADREAFEKWAIGAGLSVLAVTTGEYFSGATQTARHVWQAAQAAMPVDPDAALYRHLQRGLAGIRDGNGLRFDMRFPKPVGNIMQGSVAQHLKNAIEAEISRIGGKS